MRTAHAMIGLLVSFAASPALLCAATPETGVAGVADIGVTLEILDYTIDGAYAENLVRLRATNHGPDAASSFLVSTCTTDAPPIGIEDDFPGGCHSYGLVAPCSEFGLGFAFGTLPAGASTSCLARMRGPQPPLHYAFWLGVNHLKDSTGAGMTDPNDNNDAIYLRPTGTPPVQLGTLSSAAALVLAAALAVLGRQRMPRPHGGR